MCKDMGRSHEEYSKKLEKLRRSLPAAASQATAAGTRASGNANSTATAPQRSARPERTERPNPTNASKVIEEFTSDVSPK